MDGAVMSEIKKRPGWNNYSKPFAPMAPRKPEKENKSSDYRLINSFSDDSSYRLGDMTLPTGVKLEDVVVTYDDEPDYEGGASGGCTVRFSVETETVTPNAHYESQLKKYEKDYEKYKEEKKSHKKEVEEWKAWVKQEEIKYLKHQIENAQALLKKHGKL
jgi:hypothetical protein